MNNSIMKNLRGQIKKLNDLDFVKKVGNSNKDYIKNLLDEEQLYEDLKNTFINNSKTIINSSENIFK